MATEITTAELQQKQTQTDQFNEVNRELQGALDGTATWENEQAKHPIDDSFGAKIGKWMAYLNGLRIMRAVQRYGAVRGALLAGGIAYSALFAIAGALTIALTALSVVLGGNQQLFDKMISAVNAALPGILKTPSSPDGLIEPDALIVDNPFNIVTFISIIVLLWSALSLMAGLRTSIQAMFGLARIPTNFFMAKFLDLSGFLIIGLGVIVSVGLSTVAAFFSEQIFGFLSLPESWGQSFINGGTFLIGLAVDTLVFMFIFRYMAGARAPRKDLVMGSFFAGFASSLLRVLGTTAVSSVANNPLLAPFAAIATILLWVNLIARITLQAGAFIANPPEQLAITKAYYPHIDETPNYVSKSDLHTLEWEHDPITGVVLPDLRAGLLDKLNTKAAAKAKQLAKELEKREKSKMKDEDFEGRNAN
ncbi:YihY/virulence factor BrkB family protein [Arcanobacterium ihumii]|uniref:YihY/virulence factor BrkB family protein n=1 Tax=Arcanobacterium ihumii TaxID=2138162 RepID=UPI000F52A530|nr:YihY/virulence factor BrkB family protein [Arcanobacterium ihumii]